MVHFLLIIIYLAFISLGLPDAALGAAWPSMYPAFGVPLSYAGAISMIIALGTIFSSLQSDRMIRKFGTGKLTAMSVALTALALFGFSVSHSFWLLCLWAIPYGLGAGSVDAALNNYVALHYESWHMSWLHCMWGLGAMTGPIIMGFALSGGFSWNHGYRWISMIQGVLTVVLLLSLPIWKVHPVRITAQDDCSDTGANSAPLSLAQVIGIKGAKELLLCFFCYCALEQTSMLWASSYLHLFKGMSLDTSARFGSMFLVGITIGRALSGFISMKLNDTQMIRLGQGMVVAGVVVLLLPLSAMVSLIGFVLVGLGCAPIYPCIIHSTPDHFGAERSQAVIGVQMASAYTGTLIMPTIFGMIANHISISLLPFYLALLLAIMLLMHEQLIKKTTVTEVSDTN